MRVTIHQPQYLPWLGYLDKIDQAELFVMLDNVQFKKQEWQNRNRIRTAAGWQWMTVPVLQRFGQRVNEVRINTHVRWQATQLRAIEMHYARAPFCKSYLTALHELLQRPWDRLADLNLMVLRWLLDAFGIKTPIRLASEMVLREEATDRLIDICRLVGATRYLAGAGGGDYLDTGRFAQSGVRLEIQDFKHPEYRQCYKPFVPALSALDLLLNCGPDARAVLRSTRQ